MVGQKGFTPVLQDTSDADKAVRFLSNGLSSLNIVLKQISITSCRIAGFDILTAYDLNGRGGVFLLIRLTHYGADVPRFSLCPR